MTGDSASGSARVFEALRRNLLEVMPELEPDGVTMDGTLADLGCNSVDRADVVTMTMEDLAVDVPVMEFQGVGDIRSLVRLLSRYGDGAGARG